MLDAWWKTLSIRLDSGPAALHRLPETVAHIAEALWMQASRKPNAAHVPTLERSIRARKKMKQRPARKAVTKRSAQKRRRNRESCATAQSKSA
jgi:hypothetical protein